MEGADAEGAALMITAAAQHETQLNSMFNIWSERFRKLEATAAKHKESAAAAEAQRNTARKVVAIIYHHVTHQFLTCTDHFTLNDS